MYIANRLYNEAILSDNKNIDCQLTLNTGERLTNKDIESLKYDLDINPNDKFQIGGVYGASIDLSFLNFEEDLDNLSFENKEVDLKIRVKVKELYTVSHFSKEMVRVINSVQIAGLTSLWIPIGKFYVTAVKKNMDCTISVKLIDKTKFLETEYKARIKFPATLIAVATDMHNQLGIKFNTTAFINSNKVVSEEPKGYTNKQVMGFISECACGFYYINRFGEGEIRRYHANTDKIVEKGKFYDFVPAENYVVIKKVKYKNLVLGEDSGHMLELDENNPFLADDLVQNVFNAIKDFRYIPYTYKASNPDVAFDCGDKLAITDRKGIVFESLVMKNMWKFSGGGLEQDLEAKGESELNNATTYKGPISQAISDIRDNDIPQASQKAFEEAIEAATEMLTQFNGGHVVKKNGELFICDNEDIDKARKVWRWNINGLGYSSTGIKGPYRIGDNHEWTDCC